MAQTPLFHVSVADTADVEIVLLKTLQGQCKISVHI